MEAFTLIEKLSYWDEEDIEVVTLNDAIHCMKVLMEELNSHSKDTDKLIKLLKEYTYEHRPDRKRSKN